MPKTYAPILLACMLTTGMVGAAAPVSAATDATVRADDGAHHIYYTAGSGQANNPSFTLVENVEAGQLLYTIRDVVPITPGVGCHRPDPVDAKAATCVLHEFGDFYVRIDFVLGDGVDQVRFSTDPAHAAGEVSVFGGPGNDVLTSTEHILRGGEGNDTLVGGWLVGDDGNDTLIGTDDLVYGNWLLGGPGNDTITAGAGDDYAYGNNGRDRIRGGAGRDNIRGGADRDTIHGNSGDDEIDGGPGRDALSGGPGNDRVTQ